MEVLFIFVTGLIILAGAILLNSLAHALKFKTWYDFTKQPNNTSVMSYIWLFILYPGSLGAIAYISFKVLFIDF